MLSVTDLRFEHYHTPTTLGVQDFEPRISWKIAHNDSCRIQNGYEVELTKYGPSKEARDVLVVSQQSQENILTQWPFKEPLQSREHVSIRVRAWDDHDKKSLWSEPAHLEVGLLHCSDWTCERIAAPWASETIEAGPEDLFRRQFVLRDSPVKAQLYITAQGVYEAEINGERVGDHFLAPGWTSYDGRLQYQTYDIISQLVKEGWFCGRIGFEGGHRHIWGPHTALLAQLEVTYADGQTCRIDSDVSWKVMKGPTRLAEIYDGEKYNMMMEVPNWSSVTSQESLLEGWADVQTLAFPPASTQLVAGFAEPVRRIEIIHPVKEITTPTGKRVLDFGQNLVGYLRLSGIKGHDGHKITLQHAEVMENKELGIRPLRICQAKDEITLKHSETELCWEPRFTFHGFRYAQIDDWPGPFNLSCVEAVVCHTNMKPAGHFSCSDPLLNQLYRNIVWGMRGNFLSVPTDCPQRDERLGWTGDLSLFGPTACLIYDCFGILKNWLIDVAHDQYVLGGVPPMVSLNATLPDPIWCRRVPCAIWHDVTIIAPWALYQESGDKTILAQQYDSMMKWMKVLPRMESGLWDPKPFQLGDWLDPAAPPDQPCKGATDAKMVSNMFLLQSLDLMSKISAYALAICLNLLDPAQQVRAGDRLVELIRKNEFKVGTVFAATPFLCEALASTGHVQVAYAMLLEKGCPSWLYPVTMGATTVWERWDSMLPDGSINPGEMTSFNHYAFGAIAKFMYERVAGLQRLEPGWRKVRISPAIGATFSRASASHVSPQGTISFKWVTRVVNGDQEEFVIKAVVPANTIAEIVLPGLERGEVKEVGSGPNAVGRCLFAACFLLYFLLPDQV
ncbi:bacterial alpha-L-rhamnosidase-domain-containing protein [Fusarium flagelliforme]|uniref:bacterial alpha-L-rhamnosidase-domain-containing protein n=1 Tax=Fusarium flagelliforme TaxID=2675880 RepID=UPI001E8D1D88|nr:bacterial alpha-L-rhamnosidase-domain-containing protein [Fusarium flagelliforme]KAH7173141.1 bacterial alpha-L-rhamnosidase-domain-containing protein [Fusarium flagelliforme]